MRFSQTDLEFLTGESFSNGRSFTVAEKNDSLSIDRFSYLEAISKNKNILHLGFADHLPLIETKIKINKWLHKRLMEAAKRCIGIDIDEEVVEFVKTKLNISDVLRLDITIDSPPECISNQKWDYMILGEVLEHIDNPVQFLYEIRQRYEKFVDRIIITVPNATILKSITNIRKGIECINTDHRYWFTPFTLAKVGTRAGYKIEEFGFSQNYLPGTYIKRALVKRYPMLRDSVVMIFSFK